ncbi:hypothetical protein SCHPADRAFT_911964 [Schizopora paradoxa]|uniref:Uncharacterized protein n=1 Tax=Schizopora paradoxa TaxID=27342 RepID=A0A0H2R2Y8_9AGAM|nr:hypothetical protein SCHPADRAFT_911964 [Schizopora paradoxa]
MFYVNVKYLPSRSRSGWRNREGARKGDRSCVKRPVVEMANGCGRERIWFKRAVWERIEGRLDRGEPSGDLRGFATRWDAAEDAYIHVFASTLRALVAGQDLITLPRGLLPSHAAVKQAVDDARAKLAHVACKQVSLLPTSVLQAIATSFSERSTSQVASTSVSNPPASSPTSALSNTPSPTSIDSTRSSVMITQPPSAQSLFQACGKPAATSAAHPATPPSAFDSFLEHTRQLQSTLIPSQHVPNVLSDTIARLIASTGCWSPNPVPSQDSILRARYFLCECLRAVRRYSLVAPEEASALGPTEEDEEEAMGLCKEIRHWLEKSGLYARAWDDNQVLSYWIATKIFV